MGVIINNFFLAIPFYFLWNFLAPYYLVNLPSEYKDVPFWHVVGVFTLFSIIRLALFPKSRGPSPFRFQTFRFNQQGPDYRQASSTDSEPYGHIKDVTPKQSE